MNLSFVPISLHPSINCSEPLGGTLKMLVASLGACKLSGHSGGGAGKGRRAFNYVSGI